MDNLGNPMPLFSMDGISLLHTNSDGERVEVPIAAAGSPSMIGGSSAIIVFKLPDGRFGAAPLHLQAGLFVAGASLGTGAGVAPTSSASTSQDRKAMNNMRELTRCMIKLVPESGRYLDIPDGELDRHGRGLAASIKKYMDTLLKAAAGDTDPPPYPEWGLPNGSCMQFLSQLFSWVCGKAVTPEQAARCFRKTSYTSKWESVKEELQALGMFPHTWPLPLTKAGIRMAQQEWEASTALANAEPK